MTKPPIIGTVRVRAYRVMTEAVEAGVAFGLQRAHKYTETPTNEMINDAITTAVMNEICERLDFDTEEQP